MIIIADKILTQTKYLPMPLNHWAVLVQRGSICALGPMESLRKSYPRERTLVLHNAVLMPGLVNVHAHLELPPLENRIKPPTYVSWVLNLLRMKSLLTENTLARSGKANINTIIESGTTTVGEICTHGISPALLSASGIRAQVFQEIISMDPSKPLGRRMPFPLHNTSLLHFGLSPHSPHTVSEHAFSVIFDLLKPKHLPLSIHVAETKEEGKLLRRSKSDLNRLYDAVGWNRDWAPKAPSSIALLDRMGILGPHTLLVHAVDVKDSDIKTMKKTGSAVAHCPRSNHRLRVGTMPLKKLLDSGIPVGLGTDSLASVPTLNLWDEMRFACKIHQKSGISPRDILFMATKGGAQALAMDKEIGSLETGKKADIIAIPFPQKNSGDLYSDLLRETESSIMTMVNGKILHRVL